MKNDWHERFDCYKKFIKRVLKGEHDGRLELQNLESLERLESLEKLRSKDIVQCTNMSYQDYKYQEGDIVYCDPPYEDTTGYNKQDFNSKAFYEWVKTRPYQVWFSSYEISDDSFYKLKIKSINKIFSAFGNSDKSNEYLYSNKEITF